MSPSDTLRELDHTVLSNADLSSLFAKCVKLVAERCENGSLAAPFDTVSAVTPTDVAIVTSAMLKAVNMQLFELGLWQSWQSQM